MLNEYISKITIILLLVLFINSGFTYRKKAGDPFAEADNFYNFKRYEDAASGYQKLIETYGDTTKTAGYDQEYNNSSF